MSEKKKPHGVQLLLRMVVKDPDGKVLSDTGQKPAKSFVMQFLEAVFFQFQFLANQDATATDGTEDECYVGAGWGCGYYIRVKAAANDDKYGIVVGTGDTAPTSTDHTLETQLTEGVGAGNITHGAQVIETTAVVGANVDLEMKRSFPNNTGSTITIKEVGLYVDSQTTAMIHGYFCLIRDVLGAPGIDIPDKCSLTVYYTLRTTV